jgi:hypothetical protein
MGGWVLPWLVPLGILVTVGLVAVLPNVIIGVLSVVIVVALRLGYGYVRHRNAASHSW